MMTILKNYEVVLDSIEEGVFTVNRDWKIMSFNRAAERIIGIPREEAIGRYCGDVFKSSMCQGGCVLRKTMNTGNSIANMPISIKCANGKEINISVNTALLKDANNTTIGGVETFRDLSTINKLRKAYLKQHSFEDIVSKNERMQKYFTILPQIAESNSTVLIEGATGTGKELMARAIHNNSPQKEGPFVAVNCSAMPDTLVESELFGYKAGAFTDAKKDKPGRFALAQNGTLFLDEIGDISPAVQVRLLRVLQEKCYEPLGSTQTIRSNARVLTATNRNLEKMVEEGLFREDLYYRINVVKLELPTLKERKEDIPFLIDHFIEQFNSTNNRNIVGMSRDAIAMMMMYDWPGNIRELENTIEHAFVLCREGLIRSQHLPEQFEPDRDAGLSCDNLTLKEVEKQTIIQSLKRNDWKKVKTSKELGIDKNTLRRKINRLEIVCP